MVIELLKLAAIYLTLVNVVTTRRRLAIICGALVLASIVTSRGVINWYNRGEDLVETGNLAQAILNRVDLMLDVTGIDRDRALAWTAGRILQNILWFTEDGDTRIEAELKAVSDALFT